MARLNEPPAPADSLDALRRRFLRQNRDIARINSNQSLRIRGLENECARLLSENLNLRGQVLHMEKELDEHSSRRANDHALQLKEKMEVHLIELGALLAGFGLEPPTKKQSPSRQRREGGPPRKSLQLQKRPPQLSPSEAESLAAQEGRLAPIYETKTYPRQTLNREEILAMHADAVDATNSPELGPPPISRLIRDESRRSMPSPSKAASPEAAPVGADSRDRTTASPSPVPSVECGAEILSLPTPDPPRMTPAVGNPGMQLPEMDKKLQPLRGKAANRKLVDSSTGSDLTASRSIPANESNAVQVQRVGSKRKFAVSDENAAVRGMKANSNDKTTNLEKGQLENNLPIRELKNPKGIRDLASSRRGQTDSNGEGKGRSGARKPLATKSTNDDISSPRKRSNEDMAACKSSINTDANKIGATAGRMRDRVKMSVMLDSPDLQPPVVVEIKVDDVADGKEDSLDMPSAAALGLENMRPLSPSSQSDSMCPNTPPSASSMLLSEKPTSASAGGRDTPPPLDISSQGEVSRPSRRARASVSYAEPNLRDKMRRPTKELLDAVAGEGRYVQRQGHQGPGEIEGGKQLFPMPVLAADTPVKLEMDPPATEQQQEGPQPVPLRAIITDRRKRAPLAGVREVESKQAEPSAMAELGHEPDPYEFMISSSPQSRSIESGAVATEESRSSKGARRSSAAVIRDDASAAAERSARTSATRKRASMVAPKKACMLSGDDDEDDPADSSYEPQVSNGEGEALGTEGQTLSTRDRISRRRSMML
ncbi:shugoshin family protein [Grosmannia clavigera kw1407]|uniref:Shugoshin family protein n=1 Tax=Grosmannia clavigera (strain kw1407 / UAMH 11150) TaxID=655863 RepID=F0XTJ8_GROCL|nr:shugoshin family protein [Grosmannia clavigera kw1407]EFW98957.1 shugoshin family protein [Grosmannia clavigera kw1407]